MARSNAKLCDRTTALRELCRGREAFTWADLPEDTRRRYGMIAALFRGRSILACGSRVDGSYVNENDPWWRYNLRAILGKKNRVSDYDFIVDFAAVPLMPLPAWADRLKPHVAHGRTIQVPLGT